MHGRLVALVANDPTVKGGTYYPITVKVTPASSTRPLSGFDRSLLNSLESTSLLDAGASR